MVIFGMIVGTFIGLTGSLFLISSNPVMLQTLNQTISLYDSTEGQLNSKILGYVNHLDFNFSTTISQVRDRFNLSSRNTSFWRDYKVLNYTSEGSSLIQKQFEGVVNYTSDEFLNQIRNKIQNQQDQMIILEDFRLYLSIISFLVILVLILIIVKLAQSLKLLQGLNKLGSNSTIWWIICLYTFCVGVLPRILKTNQIQPLSLLYMVCLYLDHCNKYEEKWKQCLINQKFIIILKLLTYLLVQNNLILFFITSRNTFGFKIVQVMFIYKAGAHLLRFIWKHFIPHWNFNLTFQQNLRLLILNPMWYHAYQVYEELWLLREEIIINYVNIICMVLLLYHTVKCLKNDFESDLVVFFRDIWGKWLIIMIMFQYCRPFITQYPEQNTPPQVSELEFINYLLV